MWYGGTLHLSNEHILARYDDPEYEPPYYRDDLSERRWRKNEQKNIRARIKIRQAENKKKQVLVMQKQKIIQRVAQVLSGVKEKKQENFMNRVTALSQSIKLVKEQREKAQKLLEDQKLNLRTHSAIKNTKQGLGAFAVSQLKPGEMDDVASEMIMIHLLDLEIKVKKERRKGVRKNMEQLLKNYKIELQRRGISTEKADLESFVYSLSSEERRRILQEY